MGKRPLAPEPWQDAGVSVKTVPAGVEEGRLMSETVFEYDLSRLPKDPMPPDMWQDRAACYGIDPEVFFPAWEAAAGLALSYCNACSIREPCLAWALKNRERYGVWGGLPEQQRRRISRHVA